jgi:glycosyltransferase involved in cell wall biosynthesis
MTVSVIIPVFNGAHFLASAIESVLVQTRPVDEIVVVNDGSTDDSAAIAQRFSKPVHLISQPNAGPAMARNTGLLHTSGEYVAFLDSDDLMVPHRIATQVAVFERSDVEVVLSAQWLFRDGGPCGISDDAKDIERCLRPGLVPSAACIRRAAFDTYGGFLVEQRMGDFVEWLNRAITCGCSIEQLPEPLVLRRIHSANLSITGRTHYADLVKHIRDQRRRPS